MLLTEKPFILLNGIISERKHVFSSMSIKTFSEGIKKQKKGLEVENKLIINVLNIFNNNL